MNLYYLEKMIEMKQREMEQIARERRELYSSKKKRPVLFFHSLFAKKTTNQTRQVCCA
uniref:Uncharacterized protein n=1 Tax=Fictibacillus barbaricus TaxID=182136 RepID=A0ABS2Z8K2_9BACL|nr:hypothetical protein [Fictibacillus barbaricus]MBN3544469.1 hypothetical protein [Fictibacillus barbaricus]GGB66451.1 hypothetical protein GCM10007199_35930 [Fictibacillus barbaricus]